jgi:hypothetical protein
MSALQQLKRPTPLDQLHWREAEGGRFIAYVRADYITDTLDEIVGVENYDIIFSDPTEHGITCTIAITDPGINRTVRKSNVGYDTSHQPIYSPDGNPIIDQSGKKTREVVDGKNSATDAIKRAGKFFGIASDIQKVKLVPVLRGTGYSKEIQSLSGEWFKVGSAKADRSLSEIWEKGGRRNYTDASKLSGGAYTPAPAQTYTQPAAQPQQQSFSPAPQPAMQAPAQGGQTRYDMMLVTFGKTYSNLILEEKDAAGNPIAKFGSLTKAESDQAGFKWAAYNDKTGKQYIIEAVSPEALRYIKQDPKGLWASGIKFSAQAEAKLSELSSPVPDQSTSQSPDQGDIEAIYAMTARINETNGDGMGNKQLEGILKAFGVQSLENASGEQVQIIMTTLQSMVR